jgi:hypothetical protein
MSPPIPRLNQTAGFVTFKNPNDLAKYDPAERTFSDFQHAVKRELERSKPDKHISRRPRKLKKQVISSEVAESSQSNKPDIIPEHKARVPLGEMVDEK